jgi:hypothetical protein
MFYEPATKRAEKINSYFKHLPGDDGREAWAGIKVSSTPSDGLVFRIENSSELTNFCDEKNAILLHHTF